MTSKSISVKTENLPLLKMGFLPEDEIDEEGVVKVIRDAPPTHYAFKINSFSALQSSLDKYESGDFEAEGYKWKMSLYPNGNKKRNVKDHISLYLMVVDTSSLPPGWMVNVVFRFFLFDQTRDKYLVLGDMVGKPKRFHHMKTEHGFSKLLPLTAFNDPSNGYLVDDTCVFGVEVFICNTTAKGECFSMIKDVALYKHTWTVERLSQSQIPYDCNFSKLFCTGGHKWKVALYPNGYSLELAKYGIKVYMEDATSLAANQKVLTKVKWCVRSKTNEDIIEDTETAWFSSSDPSWYFTEFTKVEALLVKDTCLIEAEVSVLGVLDQYHSGTKILGREEKGARDECPTDLMLPQLRAVPASLFY